jgi:hypothetical protein
VSRFARRFTGSLSPDGKFRWVEFEPHVTVFSGSSTKAEARAVAQLIARQISPIELTADRLEHTERTPRRYSCNSRNPRRPTGFRDRTRLFSESDYILNPHLSLPYKKLPEARRSEIRATLDVT